MRHDELIRIIAIERMEAAGRRAITRAARAAPGRRPIRAMIGRALVRAGNRLLPEAGEPVRASSRPC